MSKLNNLFLLVTSLVLTGCTINFNSKSANSEPETSSIGPSISGPETSYNEPSIEESITPSVSINDSTLEEMDNYYRADNVKYTMRDINEQIGWNTLNSTGEQKMLVVPVQLSDGPTWTADMLSDLKSAFFGTSDETNWESVSSFYYKSSYGQLHITGEVTSVLKSTYTIRQLDSKGDNSSDIIVEQFENSSLINLNKRQEYDQDKDGYIDATIFIYSNAYNTNGFWAWCFYTDYEASVNSPHVNNYMWASYAFMQDGYKGENAPKGIDAHTYIHESGHLLGLDDYYCYDERNAWDAAGELEMQSYNVGDQNIYSKLALGWIKPYVVTGDAKITLHTSSLYNEAILIKNNWNGSIYDEYILMEYYTPTGLNEQDANYYYDTRDKMYSVSGLRIYHIDARLVKLRQGFNDFVMIGYTEDFDPNYVCYVGASNSLEYAYTSDSYIRYVHLLDSGNNNTLIKGVAGRASVDSAATLWTKGQTFSATSAFFKNGSNFNDNTKVGYSVTVGDIVGDAITVTISAI